MHDLGIPSPCSNQIRKLRQSAHLCRVLLLPLKCNVFHASWFRVYVAVHITKTCDKSEREILLLRRWCRRFAFFVRLTLVHLNV